jgi:hypothetical protein
MIQSLTFLSEYTDDIVDANYVMSGRDIVPQIAEFNYMIRPASAAARLAELGSSAISVQAYYTRTKASFDFICLPVQSVTAVGSVLTVTASLENLSDDFFKGIAHASAQMIITDGRNDLSSDIVKLVPVMVEDLSVNGTANSYIVSDAGAYKFTPTKGNSNESVGAISYADVLWETFGTDVTPNVGDLVKNVRYENGVISFETPSTFKEGNAVIAAKDASDKILWSWHIWLTDEPEGQVYYNNAGTMMDRNLGATSATPGDVGARGLLYQ